MKNFEEGVYSMCNIGQGWIEDARAEGFEVGFKEGFKEGYIKTLRHYFTDEEIIEALMDECGLSREEAEESLKKY